MKSLRPLLLLPLAAVAAQAYTLELELGKSHPTGHQDSNVVGLTVATQVNESFSLGLNLNSRGLVGGTPAIDLDARTAFAELTYDLNARGGIRPFIGAGVGYSWSPALARPRSPSSRPTCSPACASPSPRTSTSPSR